LSSDVCSSDLDKEELSANVSEIPYVYVSTSDFVRQASEEVKRWPKWMQDLLRANSKEYDGIKKNEK